MTRCNPGHRSKQQFVQCGLSVDERDGYIHKIRNALQHLHNLGFVHNDINPSNIMFDDKDEPIIIDFNSCCRIGESLDNIGRTPGWYDHSVRVSLPKNDLDALDEIFEWLSDEEKRDFKFQE